MTKSSIRIKITLSSVKGHFLFLLSDLVITAASKRKLIGGGASQSRDEYIVIESHDNKECTHTIARPRLEGLKVKQSIQFTAGA